MENGDSGIEARSDIEKLIMTPGVSVEEGAQFLGKVGDATRGQLVGRKRRMGKFGGYLTHYLMTAPGRLQMHSARVLDDYEGQWVEITYASRTVDGRRILRVSVIEPLWADQVEVLQIK